MKPALTPWALPSARAFLEEAMTLAWDGGGVIAIDTTTPFGPAAALERALSEEGFETTTLDAAQAREPAVALGQELGVQSLLAALLNVDDRNAAFVVDSTAIDVAEADPWPIFIARYAQARRMQEHGPAVMLLVSEPTKAADLRWECRLRRIDVTIWSDLHAPLNRREPLATLGAALAVELCGWRLDLAAELARANWRDLLDPIGWLRSRDMPAGYLTSAFAGRKFACPLALLANGDDGDLRMRVWRAQLSAIFPWLEDRRQAVIARHRRLLNVDEKQRSYGVDDVDEIEFGGIAAQLRGRIGREEAEAIDRLARIRNRLAHREPALAEDLELALRDADGR
jgi:hypothetical protein